MAVSASMPMQSVRVVKSATCGRKLVATSRFAPGKCILKELPYAYTLYDNKRGLYCDFCLKKCSTLLRCSSCKYVRYCNTSCQKRDWTRCHKQDCKTMKTIHPRIPPDVAKFVQLVSQIIQKQRRSPPCTHDDEDCFPTTVDQLESHLSDDGKDSFESLLFAFAQQLLQEDVLLAEPSSLLNMYGAINCNSFLIFDNYLIGIASGIYLRASMVNHSCDPNCQVISDGRKLQLRTVKDVTEGEECTISYVDSAAPTKERQAELDKRYRFTCKCVKCVEEINPDDGLGEELRGLRKSMEQMQDPLESQDWTKVLQLCVPYLKPMDSSGSIPVNHYLLVRVRHRALMAYMNLQEREKAAEIGQLITEHYRYHYGPYNHNWGMHLLAMGKLLLDLGRFQKARRYITEVKSVLEVTHGPQHSLMKTPLVQKLFRRFR